MNQLSLYSGDNNLAWCVHENAISKLREHFSLQGFRCYDLDATDIADANSFVNELVTHLPCDPDYYDFHARQEVNWAAVEDSLFGGLSDQKSNVVIFWCRAENLLEKHPNLVFLSIDILFSIARAKHFTIKVIFAGRGPNFDLTHILEQD